jgi:hypothetical protein
MPDCGTCENPDYTPEAQCCPDTANTVNAVDGRDRNCKIRRVLPTKGFFANLIGTNTAGFLNGSAEQPLYSDIEDVLASDGYVIIQTEGGRILALKPDGELAASQSLSLVYSGGVLKFAPFEFDMEFTDEDMASVKSGFLAALACSGTGKLTIGKFIPGCTGTRHLVIDAAGNVSCDTIEVGACRDVTAVDQLDSIWGCKDGVFSPLLPVVGKTLIGSGDPVKWVLGENLSNKVLLDTRYLIAKRNSGFTATTNIPVAIDLTGTTSGTQSGTFDMTVIPSYVAGYTIAWVRIATMVNATGAGLEALAHCVINGEIKSQSWIDTVNDFGYKNDVLYPVKLTGDSFTYELYTYAQSGTQTEAFVQLEIVGWEK